jgi:hypothetical protein
MKQTHLIISLAILLAAIACTKGGDQESATGTVYTVTATASAKQLVPAIDTTSTGAITGLYDDQLNDLTVAITWNDLWRDTKKDTITAIAFYGPAAATANGALVRSLPFTNPNRAGTINLGLSGGTGFSAQEKADFLAGGYYFTINTKRYPSGIIRGQLVLTQK